MSALKRAGVLFACWALAYSVQCIAQPASKRGPRPILDAKTRAEFELYAEGYGQRVRISEPYAFVAAGGGSLTPGYVAVLKYDEASGEWNKVTTLEAGPPLEVDAFGKRIDTDGKRLIVSAPEKNGGEGAVYVYRLDSAETWTLETVLTRDPERDLGQFATWDIAISGDYIAVGSFGVLWLFEFETDEGEWKLVREIGNTGGLTGPAVQGLDLDGDRLVIGDIRANDDAGEVFVYERNPDSGEWIESANLVMPEAFWLGEKVSISGDRLITGARVPSAAAHIFEYDSTSGNWIRTYQESPLLGAPIIDGDFAVVPDFTTGTAKILHRLRTTGEWVVEAELSGEPGRFGRSGDLYDGLAIFGEVGDEGNGQAVIYRRAFPSFQWEEEDSSEAEGIGQGSISGTMVSCIDGMASVFPCRDVSLASYVNDVDLRAKGEGFADIWGWTDPETGAEYVILTHEYGVTFVDIRDPVNPVVVGLLRNHQPGAFGIWHDVKTFKDHAYIVMDSPADGFTGGVQVFDLTQLRSVANPPVIFTETAHYNLFGRAHNIAINEQTGFGYALGVLGSENSCGGGLYILDLSSPEDPTFVNCYADERTGPRGNGYTHDAQCVLYQGPDPDYQGHELCFGANATHIQITDVTDKENIFTVAIADYPTVGYVHQGWLSEDHKYFYVDDETDEGSGLVPWPTTYIFDVVDLDDPVLAAQYESPEFSADHNLFVKGHYMYQSNYAAGFRMVDVSTPDDPVEIAYFDTAPAQHWLGGGSWANYPFFESGYVAVSSGGEGLFIVLPDAHVTTDVDEDGEVSDRYALSQNYPNPFNRQTRISFTVPNQTHIHLSVIDALGRTVAELVDGEQAAGIYTVAWDASEVASGVYHYRLDAGTYTESHAMTVVH